MSAIGLLILQAVILRLTSAQIVGNGGAAGAGANGGGDRGGGGGGGGVVDSGRGTAHVGNGRVGGGVGSGGGSGNGPGSPTGGRGLGNVGGPSTFGYDASSACSKPYSRHGRGRFEKLPCDFRRQNWCTVAGNAYPWHAVRRFVQENQGLVRRMYGDERHLNILKAEFEKNDVELEYEDRYPRHPDDLRQFQYEDDFPYELAGIDKEQEQRHRESYQGRGFAGGGSTDETTTERNVKYNEWSIEPASPRIHPTDPSTTDGPRSSSSTSGLSSLTEASSLTPSTDASTATESLPTRSSTSSSVASTETSARDTTATSEITSEPMRKEWSVTENIGSLVPAVSLADIARIKNSSINEIPGESDSVRDEGFDPSEEPTVLTESIVDGVTTLESRVTRVTARSPIASTIDRIGEEDELKEDSNDAPLTDRASVTVSLKEPQQEFRPRPEYRPAEAKPDTSSLGGQLFQDVAAKDHQDQPLLKLRGVNACPVKEEVVAPFWANNTRGEVLALLNLYPFEQYVHWEKCTHENKQMYCRDGCRCEQQYRLHRLLAYDPNNECRGIFSDWFKFPSCCVCRCYDLPVEFRVTSRSPRIQKQKLKLRSPVYRRERRV